MEAPSGFVRMALLFAALLLAVIVFRSSSNTDELAVTEAVASEVVLNKVTAPEPEQFEPTQTNEVFADVALPPEQPVSVAIEQTLASSAYPPQSKRRLSPMVAFSSAPQRDRALFLEVTADQYEAGIHDAVAINQNHEFLRSFFEQVPDISEDELQISCSQTICYVDLFGSSMRTRKVATLVYESWRENDQFLQTMIWMKNGDDSFRFYLVRNDFPVALLGDTD